MDLAAWWQARRWVGLLELIDQLPTSSRLQEAIQDDPEHALLIALEREEKSDEDRRPWAPRLSEFDLHAMQMNTLIQEVVNLRAAVVRHRKRVPPVFPWPVTEVDRMAARLEAQWADQMDRAFTPHAIE